MSHVSTIECVIREKDLPDLKKAAEALGLVFNEGQKTHKWYGQWVNDYNAEDAAYKHGINPKNYGKCDHAISVPGNGHAYEVGVTKVEDGTYRLVYDFFDGGRGMSKFIGPKGEQLFQEFGKQKVFSAAAAQGFSVESVKTRADGKAEILLTPGAKKLF
jgi:hypothetical protein